MKGSSFRSPLSKLVESVNEGNDDHEDQYESDRVLSAGLNTPCVPSKATGQNGNATRSVTNRSADEQLPSSMCFVRLSDMSSEEWSLFLEKFQELLNEALHERARVAAGQRMKQRLGTSCKF
uniref:1-phosphatidylinositol 4-kinase n=1 Tax=Arundo donax TaxID=35708 RepID=A0A0A9D803_ARUDO